MKTNFALWLFFVAVLAALAASASAALAIFKVPDYVAITICWSIAIYFFANSLIAGWTVVTQQWDCIVEVFGVYIGRPLKPGKYILFPWFNFVVFRKAVFKGEQMMELYLDEQVSSGYGGGDVEFKDCSSGIKAFLYYKIFDSELATYSTNNKLKDVLEEKADSLLRTFLGAYELEEVIEMRNNFYLEAIATLTDFHKFSSQKEAELAKPDIISQVEMSEFYRALGNWGVTPTGLVISDIKLTPEIVASRKAMLDAKNELKAAESKKKTAIITAEGEKQARITLAEGLEKEAELLGKGEECRLTSVGKGMANQIKQVSEAGLYGSNASKHIVETKKWSAIENSKATDKVVIVENDGAVGTGAKIGAGIEIVKK